MGNLLRDNLEVIWEPEETIGKVWHDLAEHIDPEQEFPNAAVDFDDMRARIGVLFRGLGGDPSVEVKPVAPEKSRHRRSLLRRLVATDPVMARPSFDNEALRLPDQIAVFPDQADNAALYLWLAAMAAFMPENPVLAEDPLQRDLALISIARKVTDQVLEAAPGLRPVWARLAKAHLAMRGGVRLYGSEAKIDALIRHLLGASGRPESALLAALDEGVPEHWRAPRGYRPFQPVPLWLDARVATRSDVERDHGAVPNTGPEPEESSTTAARRAKRKKADQADRRDSLILYKFEAMLSWAEFLNLNRRVEDDDLDNARKAVEDHDEITLGEITKAPATRLKLHLDLAPEDVDRERIADAFTYPEWDVHARAYLPDHTRILAAPVEATPDAETGFDAAARRRIQAVRRQFEALRPARVIRHAQPDGEELDLDATLRAITDQRATGESSHKIWKQARFEQRDLAVSILLDVSRSTESAVTGRPVIDIAREALTALAWGLHACGNHFAIDGFSSLKRDRVWVHGCKGFKEPMSSAIEARIAALRPGFYTRLGAAIRHSSAMLAEQARARHLLIVLTDGKPNDLDHYEGRHGIEDSAMAVREARRAGQSVFGITIDKNGQEWFPRLFGPGGFAVIRDPDRLTAALPHIYRQLVG